EASARCHCAGGRENFFALRNNSLSPDRLGFGRGDFPIFARGVFASWRCRRGEQVDCRRIEKTCADLEKTNLCSCGDYGGGGADMNWANRLTLSRLVLTVLFVAALSSPWPYAHTTALITF